MTRPKQGKIPEALWQQVSELVEHYSISKICRSLNITPNQIKNNISPSEEAKMQFVEVTNSTKVESRRLSFDNCAIEIHRRSGDKLTIASLPAESISQIIRDFVS
tara:strand:- start:2096 stop:2410 length:315 start_codon:yes stop_codon:yes gene_type:complete